MNIFSIPKAQSFIAATQYMYYTLYDVCGFAVPACLHTIAHTILSWQDQSQQRLDYALRNAVNWVILLELLGLLSTLMGIWTG